MFTVAIRVFLLYLIALHGHLVFLSQRFHISGLPDTAGASMHPPAFGLPDAHDSNLTQFLTHL